MINVDKLFEAWFYSIAFFSFYAGFHGDPGATLNGIEAVIYGTMVRCYDYVKSL